MHVFHKGADHPSVEVKDDDGISVWRAGVGSLVSLFFLGMRMVRKDCIPEDCGQSGPKGGWGLAGAEEKKCNGRT